MAETLISPGVLALENDNSFITSQPMGVSMSSHSDKTLTGLVT